MKSKLEILVILLVVATIMASCKHDKKEKVHLHAEKHDLIGHKAVLNYPDFKAEVNYLSDTTLYWKTTSKEGKVAEGTEKVFLKKLNEYQYFINWIEVSGLTISQVVDLKNDKVVSYASYADENSKQGKRASVVLRGKIEIVK